MPHGPAGWRASAGLVPAQPTPGAPHTAGSPGQGGLHRAKGLGHGQHPGAGPSLPGFPPGPLALISLELCKEALPHTAPPSETKGPARLTSPHTRTLRADLDTQPRRDTNLKGQGAGPREGGRRAALSTSERAAQPGSPQPRKELEGARRDGAGRGPWSPRPLGAALPRGQDERGGAVTSRVTAAPAGVPPDLKRWSLR